MDIFDMEELDGHEFGGAWTAIKLAVLEKYLVAYTTALKNKNFNLIYIDGFAGTGRCDVSVNGKTRTIDGSARIALNVSPPFEAYYFIETSKKKTPALEQLRGEFPSRTVHILTEDANTAITRICQTGRWENTRSVLFLDPFGMEVDWETLEVVAKTGAIDVWYLFPYAGLYRNAPKNSLALDPGKEAAITRALGTERWRQEFYSEQRQTDMFGQKSEVRDARAKDMLAFVAKRFRETFGTVADPKILYKSDCQSQGAPLFALFFAVSNKNPKAYGLAMKIAQHILTST